MLTVPSAFAVATGMTSTTMVHDRTMNILSITGSVHLTVTGD